MLPYPAKTRVVVAPLDPMTSFAVARPSGAIPRPEPAQYHRPMAGTYRIVLFDVDAQTFEAVLHRKPGEDTPRHVDDLPTLEQELPLR